MGPRYRALKPMQVKTLDDQGADVLDAKKRQIYREVLPGEEVPEARHWPNLRFYVQQGHVELIIPDPSPQAAPAAVAPPGGAGSAAGTGGGSTPSGAQGKPGEGEPKAPEGDAAARSAGGDAAGARGRAKRSSADQPASPSA
jgi:hypothetical protein